MRIIYDLRTLEPRMHGMARYGLELLRAMLAEAGDEVAFGVLVRDRASTARLPKDPRVLAMVFGYAPYGLMSQLLLPKVLQSLNAGLYHCTFYAPPARFDGPMLTTVHDLIHLRFPADHGARHRLFYRWVAGPAARKSQAVFTVSQHSKRDIVELLGVEPRRVVVTPNAAGEAFRPLAAAERAAAAAGLGLPPAYVLGVGNPKPHKNLAALVQAHAILRAAPDGPGRTPPLVLVGVAPGQLKGVEPSEHLRLLPHLDDAGLAVAYAAATAVVIPSLYEGFGLPALEALACGAPLVASDRASLPEVVGKAALLAEPQPQALAEALGRLLADADLRARLAAAGPAQASRFTWAESARSVLKVYHRVLEAPRT
ncbi:MAG: glycosyltransferase family 4 protein [Thermodesulfobacteriota bacterium]